MPVFEIQANGKTFEIEAPAMPTPEQVQGYVAHMAPPAPAAAAPTSTATPAAAPPMTFLGRPINPKVAAQIQAMSEREAARNAQGRDVLTGMAKGAARTVLDAGSLVHAIPGVTRAVDAIYGQPGLSDTAFSDAREKTAYANTAQTVGGMAEGVAELAVPITKGVEALPSTARAGRAFQDVMSAAKDVPVNVNAPGKVALRIHELAANGGSMPMSVRKFLNRITDPNLGELTYGEARDFASNISRLSADEYGRLTPVIGREVANLRVTLNKAVGEAAARAGKLKEYQAAMKEYAKAAKYRKGLEELVEGAKRYAVPATLAGMGYESMRKLHEMFGGD